MFDLWVSNSKWNLIFYKIVLITQKKNFFKKFRDSNSNCDVILGNLISQLDFVIREFQTSILITVMWLFEIKILRISKEYAADTVTDMTIEHCIAKNV